MSDPQTTPAPESQPSAASQPTPPSAALRSGRRTRRVLLATLLAGGMFVAGHAFASRHNPSDSDVRERVSWMLEKAVDRLDGTDEQLGALEGVVDAHFPAALALRHEGRELRLKLAEALLADRPDPVAIEALRKRLMGLADRATLELSAALQQGAAILTPEQRQTVLEKIAGRFER